MSQNQISADQIRALMDYLEGNPDLALGRLARSMEGRSQAKRMWAQVAEILNCVSADSLKKNGEQWRTYYNEYKSKLLKKIKLQKAGISGTGGGPACSVALTECQQRLHRILGFDVGEPLPGVQQNPFNDTNCEDQAGQPALTMDNGIYDFDMFMPSTSAVPRWEILSSSADPVIVVPSNIQPQLEPELPPPVLTPAAPETADSTTPRRRRRRKTRRAQPITDRTPSPDNGLFNLETIEKLNAEATLEHARAIYKLAAAVQNIADALNNLPTTCPQLTHNLPTTYPRAQPKRRRIIASSDSDETTE